MPRKLFYLHSYSGSQARTSDPLLTMQPLYQLSYSGKPSHCNSLSTVSPAASGYRRAVAPHIAQLPRHLSRGVNIAGRTWRGIVTLAGRCVWPTVHKVGVPVYPMKTLKRDALPLTAAYW